MAIVCSRALLTAREMSAVRRLNVRSPHGVVREMEFLPWESLKDVAARAARDFGIWLKAPAVQFSGKLPPQDTSLVCFINGDELQLVDG